MKQANLVRVIVLLVGLAVTIGVAAPQAHASANYGSDNCYYNNGFRMYCYFQASDGGWNKYYPLSNGQWLYLSTDYFYTDWIYMRVANGAWFAQNRSTGAMYKYTQWGWYGTNENPNSTTFARYNCAPGTFCRYQNW